MQILVSLDLTPRYMEISKVFPIITHVKSCDTQDGAKFEARAIIWARLVEAH